MNRNRLAKLERAVAMTPCPRCRQFPTPTRSLTASARAAWDALTDAERAEISALMARTAARCAACGHESFDLSRSTDDERRRSLALLRRVLVTPFSGPAPRPRPLAEETL